MTDLERLYNISKYLWFHSKTRMEPEVNTTEHFYLETSCLSHQGKDILTPQHGLRPAKGLVVTILEEHFPDSLSVMKGNYPDRIEHFFNIGKLRMDVAFGATNECWIDLKTCPLCVTRLIEALLPNIKQYIEEEVRTELFQHLRDEKMRQLGILP